MSANETNQPAGGGSLPLIPEDVLREAEARLKRGKARRNETKRKIENKEFRHIDTDRRLRARVGRILGDPAAAGEATKAAAGSLETLGADDELPDVLLERIIGGVNFLGIRFFDLGKRAARATVRVDIRTPDGRSGSGTGTLVSRRLVLTNNHVLKDRNWARLSRVVFDFEDDLENKTRPTVTFGLAPEDFFFTDPAFDFTLVAVRETSQEPGGVGLDAYGFNPLDAAEGKIAVGEPLNIIQHPSGLHKQVVLQENRLLDLSEDPPGWLHYESDTLPGSSGAPLFNNRWEMVGLHHAGWPARNEQGQILTVDGLIWRREMGELAIKWLGNEGARVGHILTIVGRARSSMEAAQRAILDELMTPPKSGTVVAPPPPAERPPGPSRDEDAPDTPPEPRPSHGGVASHAGGEVVINLPLRISVRLGDPEVPARPAPPPPAAPDAPPSDKPTGLQGADRAEAVRELTEAIRRPYYDAASDAVKRGEYYRPVDLTNPKPDDLFDGLSRLLTSTHTTRLPYKPARHLYPAVDLHPDRKLRSIYTTDVYGPQELIEEAFNIEAAFEARLESLFAAGDDSLESLSLLEAGPAYNCEHVVPRSWFRGPLFRVAEGDLHHLFTCKVECNSFRENVPFWEFPDFNETVVIGCGRREENRFEPARGKGAAARATLYFLLRYPGLIDDEVRELQAERVSILLAWHQQEPVSDYERHRNAVIQEKQGNRNPLVDFPDLAGRINFARGLGNPVA